MKRTEDESGCRRYYCHVIFSFAWARILKTSFRKNSCALVLIIIFSHYGELFFNIDIFDLGVDKSYGDIINDENGGDRRPRLSIK